MLFINPNILSSCACCKYLGGQSMATCTTPYIKPKWLVILVYPYSIDICQSFLKIADHCIPKKKAKLGVDSHSRIQNHCPNRTLSLLAVLRISHYAFVYYLWVPLTVCYYCCKTEPLLWLRCDVHALNRSSQFALGNPWCPLLVIERHVKYMLRLLGRDPQCIGQN